MGPITLEEIVKARISGYVLDTKGAPIESAGLKIKGIKTQHLQMRMVSSSLKI